MKRETKEVDMRAILQEFISKEPKSKSGFDALAFFDDLSLSSPTHDPRVDRVRPDEGWMDIAPILERTARSTKVNLAHRSRWPVGPLQFCESPIYVAIKRCK